MNDSLFRNAATLKNHSSSIFMKTTRLFSAGCLFISISLLFSCGENAENIDAIVADTSNTVINNTGKNLEAERVFSSIPSPVEAADILQRAGVSYDASLLNGLNNAEKYTTTNARALNLGIYGSDLAFTSLFEKPQESMLYLKCVARLSDQLGIKAAFDDRTQDRLQSNTSNRDSILHIISESFWICDKYLQDNERKGTSSLIVAGGWIEGMYIACRLANTVTNKKEIISRIVAQRLTLDNIVNLLKLYKDDSSIQPMLADFTALQGSFDAAKISAAVAEAQNKPGNELISPEQLTEITKSIETLRNRLIN